MYRWLIDGARRELPIQAIAPGPHGGASCSMIHSYPPLLLRGTALRPTVHTAMARLYHGLRRTCLKWAHLAVSNWLLSAFVRVGPRCARVGGPIYPKREQL